MREGSLAGTMSDPALVDARERVASWFVTEREIPEVGSDLFRRCVKASRGLAFAEALVLLVVGFTLDGLGLLRFPGYAAGALAAVLVLAGGRLVHGRNLARRLAGQGSEEIEEALDGARLRNALAAIAAVLATAVWLVFFSAGVPPWAL